MTVLSVNLGVTDDLFHLRPLSLPLLSIPGLLNLCVMSETGDIRSEYEQHQIQHIKRRMSKYTCTYTQSCTGIFIYTSYAVKKSTSNNRNNL